MDTGLAGKVALVAASSRGIGYAIAAGLAGEGARLVLCARGAERLEAAAAEIRTATGAEVLAVAADLADPGGPRLVVEAGMARFGRIDVLVTNTGGPPPMSFSQVQEEQWLRTFETLFLSAERLIRLVLPGMTKARWGRVVALTSCACREPVPGIVLSNAVRISIHGLLKSLVLEYGESGVTFNAVLPGFTLTDRMKELLAVRSKSSGRSSQELAVEATQAIPLRRAANPDEVAAAVVFLCSHAASYITGVSLPVDGGRGGFVL
ncbi:MAG: SDR family oxidoreductase [Deltaproteobacteria bacterium]|nr:SDR family oxidoreductase [Deltaproteobacteria bacterium]